MSETPLPEPLENFLKHPPKLPASAEMREALFQRSAALLPRRRTWQRWPVFAAIAASILLALATAYFGLHSNDTKPLIVERKSGPVPENPNPQPSPRPVSPKEEPQSVAAAPVHPLDQEWAAFDAKGEQKKARLYFQAG